MNLKKMKNYAKKAWRFIWDDDSALAWGLNILLAFLLIKFIVYPGLGFAFQTDYPIVAVVSGSMEHNTIKICIDSITTQDRKGNIVMDCSKYDDEKGEICGKAIEKIYFMNFEKYWNTCGDWYASNTNITEEDFKEFRFKNGFNTGDIMILYGTKPEKVKVGDTIVFTTSSRPDPIIHRVVKISKNENGKVFFQTKGDHNSGINNQVSEQKISTDRYIGKAVIRVPYLGWIKIVFVKLVNLVI